MPTDTNPTTVFKAAILSQFGASLSMLADCLEKCPPAHWDAPIAKYPFWHVAYHTLFFTHLYLQPDHTAFRPWEHHRPEYENLGPLPWPPHRLPNIGQPYTRPEVLDYWRRCDAMVDPSVDALDLSSPDCGFPWYGAMPKLDHQLVNLRHVQHHTAILSARLRQATGAGVDWRGSA